MFSNVWVEVSRSDLQVGNTYYVEWEDCCVAGNFTSELVEIEDPDWPELRFANGVELLNTHCVSYAERRG